ncbi:lytic transglycosylase domain-containing protein [Enterobacter asburiae]|uniref:lytic transglycosylase domain-containing protein n=1 Tax=Enterobacter asburiae TaxID=61645 RepID=UPI0021D30C45|nr:lytic transglycosylase domain-containing protein [Enterobacter asburiae]MCU6244029.1 lytic transglycosylase domain-containing protein [Enterobacter asburiae]
MYDVTPYLQCIHEVAPHTIQKVIAVESGGNPLAINVNGLSRYKTPHPKTRDEAIATARHWISLGYSVDMGLMQVNSRNLAAYGTDVAAMFSPCANIRTGSQILYNAYQSAKQRDSRPAVAVQYALSMYNTGSMERGFHNGYVQKYVKTAFRTALNTPVSPAANGTTIDTGNLYD